MRQPCQLLDPLPLIENGNCTDHAEERRSSTFVHPDEDTAQRIFAPSARRQAVPDSCTFHRQAFRYSGVANPSLNAMLSFALLPVVVPPSHIHLTTLTSTRHSQLKICNFCN